MQLFLGSGIRVNCSEDIFVDALSVKGKKVLVTHAHTDHAKITKSNEYFLTPETSALLSAGEKENVNCIPQGKRFSVNGFNISFHNSGHICGSSQILLENSTSLAITSDFKLQQNLLTKPAEILHADLLLIEATYGTPQHSFKKRAEIYEEMKHWVNDALSKNHFVILGGYSSGKAQELTKFCNEYLSAAPLVYKTIYEKNKALEGCGISLGDYMLLNNNYNESNILIVPPHLINDNLIAALSEQLKKKISAAVATGMPFGHFKRFELSDHADFNQLLYYVAHSRPKAVFTYHGHAEHLARQIRKKLGIPAQPLSKAQKNLLEFSG